MSRDPIQCCRWPTVAGSLMPTKEIVKNCSLIEIRKMKTNLFLFLEYLSVLLHKLTRVLMISLQAYSLEYTVLRRPLDIERYLLKLGPTIPL